MVQGLTLKADILTKNKQNKPETKSCARTGHATSQEGGKVNAGFPYLNVVAAV